MNVLAKARELKATGINNEVLAQELFKLGVTGKDASKPISPASVSRLLRRGKVPFTGRRKRRSYSSPRYSVPRTKIPTSIAPVLSSVTSNDTLEILTSNLSDRLKLAYIKLITKDI